MVNRKTNKVIKKNKKTRKQRNNKTKRGGNVDKYKNVSIDVIITNGHDDKPIVEGEKRKLDFIVKSFYNYYDYLNEVDMFLKYTLNNELLAFTDPKKHEQWKATHKPKIYSYKYGYEESETKEAANATNKQEAANATNKQKVANAEPMLQRSQSLPSGYKLGGLG